MLSIAKLTPGQERYYERSVAAGLDDYYAGRGESPGEWTGRGAAALGLAGVVGERQLGTLIRGLHPVSEERLRRHPKQRTITVERIDPHSGERRSEEKKLAPVAGFDLVFSVPKSVSLLHALGDEDTRRAVNDAHRAAWQAALAYLEEEACVTRRGRNGVVREQAGGFVAAAYQHRTSRAQDPHLHTHVIVANMAQSPSDERWRALDGEAILKSYRLAAGYLYEAQLRAELSRSLGVEWNQPEKGWADIAGVPPSVLAEFSTRRLQVVDRLSAESGAGFYAAQVAAVETRQRKEHVELVALREDWRARAAEHGLGRRELARLLQRRPRLEPPPDELRRTAQELLGASGLTERRTSFSAPELVMAWAQAHRNGTSVERVRRLCARFVELDGVEPVGDEPAPGRPARYSTAELMEVERRALALVGRLRGMDAPRAPQETQERVLAERAATLALSPEQEAMVRTVATSGDGVVCVVGLAGAGKTTATRALAEVLAAGGVRTLGAAPSGVAAEKLQDETGIRSTTLHRLLADADQGGGLAPGCVLVLDEAGMAETRLLAPLLERVEQANAKLVLLGDPHQLPAVGAGGLFAAIVERHGAIELSENRRQRDLLEQEALAAIRQGFGRDYLAYAENRERLVVSDSPLATRARLLADWWNTAREDLAGNVMIALRRRDVAELNALARTLMETHGRLGPERLTIGDVEFASGDRVVCRRNSDLLGVKNGTRGTVETLDRERRTLDVLTDRGERVTLSSRYLAAGHLRHAYALTGHAGQGITVDRAFVLGSGEARLQEWGYVALSRARQATHLYVTAAVIEREAHAPEADERDPLTRMAQALEESSLEPLAVDQHPLQSGPKHQTRAEIDRPQPNDELRIRLRLLEQERVATTKARRAAEQKLEQAERELARLGFLARRRRGDALEAEIATQRNVIDTADVTLVEINDRRRVLRARAAGLDRGPELANAASTRRRAQERGVEARAPGLEL